MSTEQEQGFLRRVVLAWLACFFLPLQAAEPIALRVIPYQGSKLDTPIFPALLTPPPFIGGKNLPRKSRLKERWELDEDDDFDWLMD